MESKIVRSENLSFRDIVIKALNKNFFLIPILMIGSFLIPYILIANKGAAFTIDSYMYLLKIFLSYSSSCFIVGLMVTIIFELIENSYGTCKKATIIKAIATTILIIITLYISISA